MSIRYGNKDCDHKFVHRKDGYEEGCCPAICKKCGAFGCACDIGSQLPDKTFFSNGVNSYDNIGG